MITIRLIGLGNGPVTEFDGKYLVEYDPHPFGDAEGEFCHLITTTDPADAAHFATLAEAIKVYRATSGRIRPDLQPDRPLTAFTVAIEEWPRPEGPGTLPGGGAAEQQVSIVRLRPDEDPLLYAASISRSGRSE